MSRTVFLLCDVFPGMAELSRMFADHRVLCLGSRLAERLAEGGWSVPAVALPPESEAWRAVHREAESALEALFGRSLHAGAGDPTVDGISRSPARSDWSTWLVAEASLDLAWTELARQVVEAERPVRILLHEPPTTHPLAPVHPILTEAFLRLGVPVETWRPSP